MFCLRGGDWGQRGKSSKNTVCSWAGHDNQLLKVQIYCREIVMSMRKLLFAHLRSKTQRSKARVLGRRVHNGKPQKRLRFINCGPRGGTQGAEPSSGVQRFGAP